MKVKNHDILTCQSLVSINLNKFNYSTGSALMLYLLTKKCALICSSVIKECDSLSLDLRENNIFLVFLCLPIQNHEKL